MSYAYPIYEDKVNKQVIRFYHCSDKKSNVRTQATEHVPGTILDDNMEVLYTPKYQVVGEPNDTHTKRLAILDCTVINLYYMDGEWYMGTKNSWNIRKLQDFVSTTYGQFFDESLSIYPKFSYDALDKTKMYTLLFTNPNCHLLAKQHAVYVYSATDELANIFPVLPEETHYKNYVLLSETENSVYICESEGRKLCTSKLYSARSRCYSKDHNFAIVKTFISAYCKCKPDVRHLFEKHTKNYLNENYLSLFEDVVNVFGFFNEQRPISKKIGDLYIPAPLVKDPTRPYTEKDIGFFVNLYKHLTA